jgi:capreomycidine synthase
MTLSNIAPALLEDWLRDRYFAASIDISSSGMENYSVGELRALLGIDAADLDGVRFRDSPSLGTDALRAAVAARFRTSADRVMMTHGSSEAIFLALSVITGPGDEVIVTAPAYQSLSSIVAALGARVKPWDLAGPGGFAADPVRLGELLTPATRAVIVNFPHNPTGTTLNPAAFTDLIGRISRHGCYLLWDGAFSEIVYEGAPLPDPAALLDRCISVGTLSKAYGLPCLRVGWCTAAGEVLAAMVRLRDYVTISTSPLTEMIATAVLTHPDKILLPRLAQARQNRTALGDWAGAESARVDYVPPAGGTCAFPRIRDIADVTGLCAELAERYGVLTVPGRCFGHPDRMRIGFGGPSAELTAGLTRLSSALADWPADDPLGVAR